MSFCGVFDDYQVVPAGNVPKRLHIHRMPIDMDRHNCLGTGSDFCLDLPDIHAPSAGVTIHQNRGATIISYGLCAGDNGKRGQNNFLAGLQIQAGHGQL